MSSEGFLQRAPPQTNEGGLFSPLPKAKQGNGQKGKPFQSPPLVQGTEVTKKKGAETWQIIWQTVSTFPFDRNGSSSELGPKVRQKRPQFEHKKNWVSGSGREITTFYPFASSVCRLCLAAVGFFFWAASLQKFKTLGKAIINPSLGASSRP